MNLVKFQGKKSSLINRLKFAQHKIYCICIAVYKNYDGEDFNEIFSFLSKLKNKLKVKNELIEKHKNMNEDFEQNSYSNSAAGIYKIGHVSIRIMKWLAYYDKVKY